MLKIKKIKIILVEILNQIYLINRIILNKIAVLIQVRKIFKKILMKIIKNWLT